MTTNATKKCYTYLLCKLGNGCSDRVFTVSFSRAGQSNQLLLRAEGLGEEEKDPDDSRSSLGDSPSLIKHYRLYLGNCNRENGFLLVTEFDVSWNFYCSFNCILCSSCISQFLFGALSHPTVSQSSHCFSTKNAELHVSLKYKTHLFK